MNLWIVVPVTAAMVALRLLPWRLNTLLWAAVWWLATWVVLDFGFAVPVPSSVVKLFMGIVTLALFAYITSDREKLEEVRRPTVRFMTERRFLPALLLTALAVPGAVATSIYLEMTKPPKPPVFGRTIHPAPPGSITVHETQYNLTTLVNPYRELETTDPDAFREHVEAGREIYYANCFFCHGDLMRGEGMFASALNPIPTNFQDSGTIAQLQESFLFWRISKGAPGMPDEGGPWASAMPAWESFLTEEEMWDVILFLYEFTGHRPRARHADDAVATEGEH